MDYLPQTEMEKKRTAWWAEHAKPVMSLDDAFRLNEEVLTLFPVTPEERLRKWERLKAMPEFVL